MPIIIPEPIPFQRHILQELSAVLVKVLSPSQKAGKKQALFQSNYTPRFLEIIPTPEDYHHDKEYRLSYLYFRIIKSSLKVSNHILVCMLATLPHNA